MDGTETGFDDVDHSLTRHVASASCQMRAHVGRQNLSVFTNALVIDSECLIRPSRSGGGGVVLHAQVPRTRAAKIPRRGAGMQTRSTIPEPRCRCLAVQGFVAPVVWGSFWEGPLCRVAASATLRRDLPASRYEHVNACQ